MTTERSEVKEEKGEKRTPSPHTQFLFLWNFSWILHSVQTQTQRLPGSVSKISPGLHLHSFSLSDQCCNTSWFLLFCLDWPWQWGERVPEAGKLQAGTFFSENQLYGKDVYWNKVCFKIYESLDILKMFVSRSPWLVSGSFVEMKVRSQYKRTVLWQGFSVSPVATSPMGIKVLGKKSHISCILAVWTLLSKFCLLCHRKEECAAGHGPMQLCFC